MRERGVEEKSQGSWGSGLPARGSEARFHSPGLEGTEAAVPREGSDTDSPTTDSFSADIVFIVKQDGTVLYLNRMLPNRPEGAAGSSLFDYTDEEYHDVVRRSLDLVFSSGTPHGYECQGVDPFRESGWYQCRVAPNRREGRVVSATIIARDVTSWRGAEQGPPQGQEELSQEYQRASTELERLRGELAQGERRQEEVERFQQDRDRLEADYQEVAKELQRLRDELARNDDRQDEEERNREERDRLRGDYQTAASELERLRQQLAEGESKREELDRFQRERDKLQLHYERVNREMERVRGELSQTEDRQGEADRSLQGHEELKGEHDRVAGELERLRAELQQGEGRQEEANRFRQEYDQLKSDYERVAAELEQLREQLAPEKARQEEIERFRQERDQLKEEHDRVARELEALRSQLAHGNDDQEEADRFRRERDELRGECERVAGELERLQSQLEASEQRQEEVDRFRAIMDQAGEAIFITDPETGRFIDANETACRWLGYRREKLLTLSIKDLDVEFPLESPNGVPEHVTDTRGATRPIMFSDGRHRRRNGTSFPVEVAINRRLFGTREYILVVARDIKGRKLTQQAVRESEDKFRSLFELTRDAVYLSARDGSVADVNDAAIDLFGYTRAEFLNLEARRLYVRPDDIRTFQRSVDRAGSVRDMEVNFRTKDGTEFAGLLTATLRHDGEGNVLGYQCIVHPVSHNGRDGKSAAPGAAAAAEESSEIQAGGKTAVLVMDNDKRVLVEVLEVLERAGITVLTARTSAAAIEVYKAESEAVGAILLGDNDADMEPADAVGQLRSIDPNVSVVLLSETRDGPAAARATPPGFKEVVRKPVHPLALIQHVRDALASRRSG
jgi:PAS domain S-box-containing protein